MVVQKTSVFPAGRDFVFQKLQQLKTLQYITWPYQVGFITGRKYGKECHKSFTRFISTLS